MGEDLADPDSEDVLVIHNSVLSTQIKLLVPEEGESVFFEVVLIFEEFYAGIVWIGVVDINLAALPIQMTRLNENKLVGNILELS